MLQAGWTTSHTSSLRARTTRSHLDVGNLEQSGCIGVDGVHGLTKAAGRLRIHEGLCGALLGARADGGGGPHHCRYYVTVNASTLSPPRDCDTPLPRVPSVRCLAERTGSLTSFGAS